MDSMVSLSSLEAWEPTAHSLHAAAELLGAIRRLVREPAPHYLHLALQIERTGISTATLPTGGRVRLDFGQAALVHTGPTGEEHPLLLTGHSQASLLEALLRAMAARGESLVQPSAGESAAEALRADLRVKRHARLKEGELVSATPLVVDAATSAGYGEALYWVFTAVARFRARLEGPQTPIVIWPEHFDLSTVWFPTNDRSDAAPQMNFGFAPFDGVHTRPYLYAYAYPMPEGFVALPLPAPARWNTAPWQGLILHYDDLRQAENPEALIEAACESAYALLAPTLAR